jgi:hypothetical protein
MTTSPALLSQRREQPLARLFVSLIPEDDACTVVWLRGRRSISSREKPIAIPTRQIHLLDHVAKRNDHSHSEHIRPLLRQGRTTQARPANSIRSILRSTESASSSWQVLVTAGRMRPCTTSSTASANSLRVQ